MRSGGGGPTTDWANLVTGMPVQPDSLPVMRPQSSVDIAARRAMVLASKSCQRQDNNDQGNDRDGDHKAELVAHAGLL